MKKDDSRLKPVLTALKKAGYKVDEVAEQGKKTVITVSAGKTAANDKLKK